MLLIIKNLYKDSALFIAIAITLSIAILSLSDLSQLPHVIHFSYLDKLEHFIAYFVLIVSWAFTFQKSEKLINHRFWLVLFVFLYGVFMELLQQQFTDYRIGDLYDVLANFSGILFGMLFFEKIIHQDFKDFLAAS